MTKIHMSTDEVRSLARLLAQQAGEIDSQVEQLRRGKGRLSFAWSGGLQSSRFISRFNSVVLQMGQKAQDLENLAVRVNREIDQWIEVDSRLGVRYKTLPYHPPHPGILYPPGYLRSNDPRDFWKDFNLKLGEGSDEQHTWTPSDGWKEGSGDPKLSIGVEIPLVEGAITADEIHIQEKMFGIIPVSQSAEYKFGYYEAGAKAGWDVEDKEGSLGFYGEVAAAKASTTKTVGTAMFGFTGGVAATVGSAEAFAGFKDNTLGASIGASAGTIELSQGINIAGYNVGINAGLSAGLEAGIILGPEVKVKAGPFKLGLHFGQAII